MDKVEGNLVVVNSCHQVILACLTWSKIWQTQLPAKCKAWVGVARASRPMQLAPVTTTATMMTARRMRAVARASAAPRMMSRVVTSSAATVRRPT